MLQDPEVEMVFAVEQAKFRQKERGWRQLVENDPVKSLQKSAPSSPALYTAPSCISFSPSLLPSFF